MELVMFLRMVEWVPMTRGLAAAAVVVGQVEGSTFVLLPSTISPGDFPRPVARAATARLEME
jgi:hypothetical protein